MSILQAIILGGVQGLTEFLPVSSSGHLIFLPKLFGWADQGVAFDAITHLGTLLAVFIFYHKKLWLLTRALFSARSELHGERRLVWLILMSAVPAGAVGFFLQGNFRSPLLIGVNFILFGAIMAVADWRARKSHDVDTTRLNWPRALGIGLAQAVSLLPGVSRSGITMTAGLLSGLTRSAAVEFSFLMSVPIIVLAGANEMYHVFSSSGIQIVSPIALIFGFVTAALSGMFAIGALVKIVNRVGFMPFVIYRFIIGALILIFLV